MPTISLTLPVSATVITAGLHSTNYTLIQNLVNGSLDNNNIATNAGIAVSKLGQSGAATGQALVWNGTAWAPGAGVESLPIDLRNPQFASNAGNSFPNVVSLTAHESMHWEFVKDVDGKLFGVVRSPGTTAAKIVLSTRYNATTGVARWSVAWASFADAASSNPASLTSLTSQDITVPGTARVRKDVTFTLGSQPPAGDLIVVQIFHEGAHANDTVAVNSEIMGAYLVPN